MTMFVKFVVVHIAVVFAPIFPSQLLSKTSPSSLASSSLSTTSTVHGPLPPVPSSHAIERGKAGAAPTKIFNQTELETLVRECRDRAPEDDKDLCSWYAVVLLKCFKSGTTTPADTDVPPHEEEMIYSFRTFWGSEPFDGGLYESLRSIALGDECFLSHTYAAEEELAESLKPACEVLIATDTSPCSLIAVPPDSIEIILTAVLESLEPNTAAFGILHFEPKVNKKFAHDFVWYAVKDSKEKSHIFIIEAQKEGDGVMVFSVFAANMLEDCDEDCDEDCVVHSVSLKHCDSSIGMSSGHPIPYAFRLENTKHVFKEPKQEDCDGSDDGDGDDGTL